MALQFYDAATALAASATPLNGAGAWLLMYPRFTGAFGVFLSFPTALAAATTFTVEADDGGAGAVVVAGPISLSGLPDNPVIGLHSDLIAKLAPVATKIRLKTSAAAAVTAWAAPIPPGNVSRIEGVPPLTFTA
jgi:hypothetical protein